MGFEPPSNPAPLMKGLKQAVRLQRASSQEAISSLQKKVPQDPFRSGQVGLILFLTLCVLAGVEASAEENAKEESLLSDPVIASFACRSFSITAGNISKIKVEKLDGLSIWAKSYKLTHEETNQ